MTLFALRTNKTVPILPFVACGKTQNARIFFLFLFFCKSELGCPLRHGAHRAVQTANAQNSYEYPKKPPAEITLFILFLLGFDPLKAVGTTKKRTSTTCWAAAESKRCTIILQYRISAKKHLSAILGTAVHTQSRRCCFRTYAYRSSSSTASSAQERHDPNLW